MTRAPARRAAVSHRGRFLGVRIVYLNEIEPFAAEWLNAIVPEVAAKFIQAFMETRI
jgi:hypothetical protein